MGSFTDRSKNQSVDIPNLYGAYCVWSEYGHVFPEVTQPQMPTQAAEWLLR